MTTGDVVARDIAAQEHSQRRAILARLSAIAADPASTTDQALRAAELHAEARRGSLGVLLQAVAQGDAEAMAKHDAMSKSDRRAAVVDFLRSLDMAEGSTIDALAEAWRVEDEAQAAQAAQAVSKPRPDQPDQHKS